ncbi:MAG: hypothetical protein Ta2B_19700 [Termitinemataceae bacterium]|nr:MAG: hypothetical protein Ta2B_19700 [Termitinemataceae bacterium]
MKKSFLLSIVVFISMAGLCFAQTNDAQLSAAFKKARLPLLESPRPIKDFTLKLTNGQSVTLSSLKGKVIFLNFWATWCPPCRAEMPSMEKLYQRFKDKGLEFIAVDISESSSDVQKFLNENKLTFPVALDSDHKVSDAYGIRYIPTTFIIDRSGKIIIESTGGRQWDSAEIFAAFEALF